MAGTQFTRQMIVKGSPSFPYRVLINRTRLLKLLRGPQVGDSQLCRSRAAADPMCAPPLVSLQHHRYVSPVHARSTVQGMRPLPFSVSSFFPTSAHRPRSIQRSRSILLAARGRKRSATVAPGPRPHRCHPCLIAVVAFFPLFSLSLSPSLPPSVSQFTLSGSLPVRDSSSQRSETRKGRGLDRASIAAKCGDYCGFIFRPSP